MMNKNSYKIKDGSSGTGATVTLVPRKKKNKVSNDFILGLLSFFPSSAFDRRLSAFIKESYQHGLEEDWNTVGDQMWLAISRYSMGNVKLIQKL